MKYQEKMRKMAISIIQEKLEEDKRLKVKQTKEIIDDKRMVRMRQDLLSKLVLLDEFK